MEVVGDEGVVDAACVTEGGEDGEAEEEGAEATARFFGGRGRGGGGSGAGGACAGGWEVACVG